MLQKRGMANFFGVASTYRKFLPCGGLEFTNVVEDLYSRQHICVFLHIVGKKFSHSRISKEKIVRKEGAKKFQEKRGDGTFSKRGA